MTETHRTILVVDDEEDFRIVLRDHFEGLGYHVIEAADGVHALEVFGENRRLIDLVITDIRMPRMPGDELIAKLRGLRRYLPIIGVTGHADLSGKLAFLDNGAYYYLDKPLPQWPIVDRLVDNAIRLHRFEEEVAAMRTKENEIARLLRAYIMKEASRQKAPLGLADSRTIDLEIEMEYIENDRPGGDYVEWFKRSDREIVFYVADASGHDDLLSCFMTCLSSMVLHRSHHGAVPSVGEIIVSIDGALSQLREVEALGHERYLTFFIGSIDLVTGELLYVNAGHPEAILMRRADGKVTNRRLESNCRPVGFLFEGRPEIGRTELRPDDLLFVYTDGASDLLEQTSPSTPGIEQLAAELERWIDRPPQEIVDRIARRLRERAGDRPFPDDTTLMALRIHAPRPSSHPIH